MSIKKLDFISKLISSTSLTLLQYNGPESNSLNLHYIIF